MLNEEKRWYEGMSDEELRLECLRLAVEYAKTQSKSLYTVDLMDAADMFYKFVKANKEEEN